MYDAYNMYKNVYDAYNMYKNFFYLNKINILIQNYSINNYITHFHTELFCKYIINHLVKYHFKSTCAVSYLFILFLTCISLELFGSLAHFQQSLKDRQREGLNTRGKQNKIMS